MGVQASSVEGFTRKYRTHKLVDFEMHLEMGEAIQREKQLKKWNGTWKIELIEKDNPGWRDLWQDMYSSRFPLSRE